MRTETITVRYADGDAEDYVAISAYRHQPPGSLDPDSVPVELPGWGLLTLSDATGDELAFTAYLATLALADELRGLSPHRLTVEQSNTSVKLGEKALFKLFRRPAPPPDREALLLRRLAHTGVAPELYGEVRGRDGRQAAIIVEYIDAIADGWQLACTSCANQTDFSSSAFELGRALRTMHHALAGPWLDADPPVTVSGVVPGCDLADAMLARLRTTAAAVPEVAGMAAELRPVFEAISDITVAVSQIHGDFHLGQALYRRSPASWVIIDFEGEPLKSASERLAPDSPWRDVAGALRSFEYARQSHADPRSTAAHHWVVTTRRAFLEGYCGAAAVPAELLRAYVVDKALYEIRYEAQSRPNWVHIPLESVQDELTRALP